MTERATEPGSGPAPEPRPLARLDAGLAALLFTLAFALYRATAPAQVNLDGLGYLKLLPHNFSAGHLLYMPLLRATTAWQHGDALDAGRLLDATCAAASVALLYLVARAFGPRAGALLAAAGLALSYAVWVQGSDVECYALALLALLILFALLLAWRALPGVESSCAVGLALAIAVLTHVTHVLASLLVVAWMLRHGGARRGRALLHAAAALAIGGALSMAAYAWAAFGVRHTDAPGLVKWVATAQHGFRYEGSPLSRLADSVYGLSRALVWSPELYGSNPQALLGQLLLGLAAAATLIVAVVLAARAGRLTRVPLGLLAWWALPYAAMALAFFGSDHERWLFVLPPLWMVAGAALGGSRRGQLAGGLLVAAIAVVNYGGGIAPAMRWTWDQTRADAATEPMRDGDLVIFPGHSWDEYVGFHSGRRVVPLPLAYYAGVLGKAGCATRVEQSVRAARARGARVWAVRLPVAGVDNLARAASSSIVESTIDATGDATADTSSDSTGDTTSDDRGLFELRQLGYGRTELAGLLSRWTAVPVATSQPTVTVHRLEERAELPAAGGRVTGKR